MSRAAVEPTRAAGDLISRHYNDGQTIIIGYYVSTVVDVLIPPVTTSSSFLFYHRTVQLGQRDGCKTFLFEIHFFSQAVDKETDEIMRCTNIFISVFLASRLNALAKCLITFDLIFVAKGITQMANKNLGTHC